MADKTDNKKNPNDAPVIPDVKNDGVTEAERQRLEKESENDHIDVQQRDGPEKLQAQPVESPRPINIKESFNNGIRDCAETLADVPDALDFGVHRTETDRHFYSFANTSGEAKAARNKIATELRRIYDNGAFSYRDFAERLRVPSLSIQAILDEEFIEANNL